MGEAARNEANQYLTFILDDELFALDIFIVREVLEYARITRIPRTESYLRGIINVRGNAVPVIDLNMKFGKGRHGERFIMVLDINRVFTSGELAAIHEATSE